MGDSVTTDHISPAGRIEEDGPAGKYLKENSKNLKMEQVPREQVQKVLVAVQQKVGKEPSAKIIKRRNEHVENLPKGEENLLKNEDIRHLKN